MNEYRTNNSMIREEKRKTSTKWLHSKRDINQAYINAWEDCKKEVLRILQQDWTGCDLSINSCDQYYIDKIKKL